MAKYVEADCRLCRSKGEKLYLKGDRCYTEKCAVAKRGTRPGVHVERPKMTEHAIQLREKQKLKNIYGLLEKQFYRYYDEASTKKGITGELLIQFLEQRLDNTAYRLGLAPSRSCARQLVRHGHVLVNGKKVDIPSYRVKTGDIVSVTSAAKNMLVVKNSLKKTVFPDWLTMNKDTVEGKIIGLPQMEDKDYDIEIELIIAFYSK